jgi:hypothetical protein
MKHLRIASGVGGDSPRDAFLANLIGSGLSFAELRAATPLEDRAQLLVDQAVVKVGLERLTFAADILSEGLIYNLPDPLSVMEVQWEQVSKQGGAQRTMNPGARGERGLAARRPKRVPVYLTTDDFSVNIRTLRASERVGAPLDTSGIEESTRRVNEGIEDAAINGATTVNGSDLVVDGYSCPGLINAPNKNTQSITTGWSSAVAGTTILSETLAMIAKLQADKKFGPYTLYVGTVIGNNLEADFKANGDLTIKQRLEMIQAGGRNLRVRVADRMPAATVALVQMTSDVVDMVYGQAPTVVPWVSPDGFTLYWLVMGVMIPRVRDDYDGNSGVCIGT